MDFTMTLHLPAVEMVARANIMSITANVSFILLLSRFKSKEYKELISNIFRRALDRSTDF